MVTGEGELKQYQFEDSFGVTKISLGNGIILNDRCFLDCRSLKEINLPNAADMTNWSRSYLSGS